MKKVIQLFNVIFFIVFTIDSLTKSFNLFDSIPTGVESVFLLIISILLIYENIFIKKSDLFFSTQVIISFSFVIFFAGTFFLFILSKNNFSNQFFIIYYGYIVAIFSIIKNALITIGLSRNNKFYISINKRFQSN